MGGRNRIVVDYGDWESLVLLDVLDTETGAADLEAFDQFQWPDKVSKTLLPGFQDTMASDIPSGEEGFVFYWPHKDFRVKMKAAEYLELHRMIFSLSERTVWERMGDGETIEDICVKLPDEFHDWVKQVGARLLKEQALVLRAVGKEFLHILSSVRGGDFEDLCGGSERKQFAYAVQGDVYKGYLFMCYDRKDIEAEVWKSLRPAGNLGIKVISEDTA